MARSTWQHVAAQGQWGDNMPAMRPSLTAHVALCCFVRPVPSSAWQIVEWYHAYTQSRDVHEQGKKVREFIKAASRFIDKVRSTRCIGFAT